MQTSERFRRFCSLGRLKFAQHRSINAEFFQGLVVLFLVLSRVKLQVIEIVPSNGGEKSYKTISGDLVRDRIFRPIHQVDVRAHVRDDEHGRESENLFQAVRLRLNVERFSREEEADDDRPKSDTRENERHRIGLFDVPDHFMGVEEIIDCNEIHSGVKFEPEHDFADTNESEKECVNGEPEPSDRARVDVRGNPGNRCDESQDRKGR